MPGQRYRLWSAASARLLHGRWIVAGDAGGRVRACDAIGAAARRGGAHGRGNRPLGPVLRHWRVVARGLEHRLRVRTRPGQPRRREAAPPEQLPLPRRGRFRRLGQLLEGRSLLDATAFGACEAHAPRHRPGSTPGRKGAQAFLPISAAVGPKNRQPRRRDNQRFTSDLNCRRQWGDRLELRRAGCIHAGVAGDPALQGGVPGGPTREGGEKPRGPPHDDPFARSLRSACRRCCSGGAWAACARKGAEQTEF
mmetsp:Transcript_47041/g.131122  ORF Transcript_47041/g.131122 Transcript_47041/m.131122 type:complete len:252 (+) Transcript_47041:615-1370(+)